MHNLNIHEIVQISFLSFATVNLMFAALNMMMIASMGSVLGRFYEKIFPRMLYAWLSIITVDVIIFSVVFILLVSA